MLSDTASAKRWLLRISIGAWLEASPVVIDLGSINSLCRGGGASPVRELVTLRAGASTRQLALQWTLPPSANAVPTVSPTILIRLAQWKIARSIAFAMAE